MGGGRGVGSSPASPADMDGAMREGDDGDDITWEGPISLWVLAERISTPWFRWWAATQSESLKDRARALARVQRRDPDMPAWKRRDQLDQELRIRRYELDMRRIVAMNSKVLPIIRGCLASDFLRFRGFFDGEMKEIDRSLAQTAFIDIPAGTVSLPGGAPGRGIVWYGVTAEFLGAPVAPPSAEQASASQPPAEPVPAPPSPRRRREGPLIQVAKEALASLSKEKIDIENTHREVLLRSIRQKSGITISHRTLSRALSSMNSNK